MAEIRSTLYSCTRTLTTRVTGVTHINLLIPLLSSKLNLLSVYDNYVISAICVRRKIRLVLASYKFCNF